MNDFITRKVVEAQIITAEAKNDETGAVAAEYGLLLAGIAVVVGVAAVTLGGKIVTLFNGIHF